MTSLLNTESKSMLKEIKIGIQEFISKYKEFRANPSTNPALIEFACNSGIHPYTAQAVIYDTRGAPIGAHLKCPHCGNKNDSYFKAVRLV